MEKSLYKFDCWLPVSKKVVMNDYTDERFDIKNSTEMEFQSMDGSCLTKSENKIFFMYKN